MKKSIYTFAFAVVLGFASSAQAGVSIAEEQKLDSDLTAWQNPGTQVVVDNGLATVRDDFIDGTTTTDDDGTTDNDSNTYDLLSQNINRDGVKVENIGYLYKDTTETVSSCPNEMLLSSDGCCCVNN